MTEYSADKLGNHWKEMAKEAQWCVDHCEKLLSKIPINSFEVTEDMVEIFRCKWNSRWSSANSDSNLPKWYNFVFVHDGMFLKGVEEICPITYRLLKEFNDHYPILISGFSWILPNGHIPSHVDGSDDGWLVIHVGLIIPPNVDGKPQCLFRVEDEIYIHEEGKLIVFDDNLTHEARNFSNQNRIILYIKAKYK